MNEDLDAADAEEVTKAEVATSAQLYGALYLVALIACVAAIWLPSWGRWPVGALVGFCMISAVKMAGRLATLVHAERFYGLAGGVAGRHRILNALAIVLLAYGLGAVWARWPAPVLAVLVAAIVNFVHYGGYRGALSRT